MGNRVDSQMRVLITFEENDGFDDSPIKIEVYRKEVIRRLGLNHSDRVEFKLIEAKKYGY